MPEGEIAGSQAGGEVAQGGSAGQVGSVGWRESLGDIGKEKSFDVFKGKDWNEVGPVMAKTFLNSEKMLGSSLRLPKKDAKPEDRQKAVGEIMGKLRAEGILESAPDNPDKYEIKYPQIEGFKPNEPLINGLKQFAHKEGIPNSQVQKLFDWYLNFQTSVQAQEDEKFETLKRGLKTKWAGLSTRKFEAARRAAGKHLGEDADQLIGRMIPEDAARIVEMFSEIGDPMLEDARVEGEGVGVANLNDVDKKIKAMFADPKHPLNDISHSGHKQAVEEYSALQKMYIHLGGK